MTEEEWLTTSDVESMVIYLLDTGTTQRKVQLLAVACCHRIWHILADERARKAVEAAERYADGEIGKRELEKAAKAAHEAAVREGPYGCHAEHAAALAASLPSSFHARHCPGLAAAAVGREARSAENSVQCALIRDIFDNPLRTPPFIDRAWLAWNDGTIHKLAQAIYDDRAFDRLPILADALLDAGCTDEAILDHCRSPGPHVRGCWVVDLVLGKS